MQFRLQLYEFLSYDYRKALQSAGIKSPKPLPVANKTAGKKKGIEKYYTSDIQDRALFIFGPFLERYGYKFPRDWKNKHIPYTSFFLFNVGGFLRKWKWKLSKKSKRKSIQGSIYGNIQRENEKS